MSDQSQGPGWWQASDGKWYPPEQAPGYQPPAGAPMPGGGGTDVGSVLSYAWNKFIQNIGEWIILWLILIVAAIVGGFIVVAVSVGASATNSFTSFSGISLLSIVFSVLLNMLYGVLLVALAKGAAMSVNGQRVDVGACFKLTSNNIIAGVIFGLVVGVLTAFCRLFGVAGWLFLGFMPVLSALDDKGADAAGEAVSLSTSRASESMVFLLIGWIISSCLCFIGGPITMIGSAYLVKRFRGEPVAP